MEVDRKSHSANSGTLLQNVLTLYFELYPKTIGCSSDLFQNTFHELAMARLKHRKLENRFYNMEKCTFFTPRATSPTLGEVESFFWIHNYHLPLR